MNEVIVLLSDAGVPNDIGDTVGSEARVEVFAGVKSVGATYKLQALAVGLRPKYRFILSDYYDYSGQEMVEYGGRTYRVIDTYRGADNSLELTVAEVQL